MKDELAYGLSRRRFLQLTSMTAAGWLVGCAANPVTGKNQLMLLSEGQEIQMDRQHSPHQFSADYGLAQDSRLQGYLEQTGKRLTAHVHRPQMPYTFHVVNAVYVNAYAFPGGSIAATRAILLQLDNEAQLAALLGHELGHVNARHTAEIMSKSILTSTLVGGLAATIEAGTGLGGLAGQIGSLGSSALLARYSRDNERQADALGLQYMVKGGYGAEGMVGLMEMLNTLSKGHSSAASTLFATHPMSDERYRTAVREVDTTYRSAKGKPLHRERYHDQTAGLRKIKNAIVSMQKGEAAMLKKDFSQAETHLKKALTQAPDDYTGLMLMAQCQMAQEKSSEAEVYLTKAREAYPEEAQSYLLDGYLKLGGKRFNQALEAFDAYDRRLAGNINVALLKGLAYEGKEDRKAAAQQYYTYLQTVNQGEAAQYAYNRLVEWGYVK